MSSLLSSSPGQFFATGPITISVADEAQMREIGQDIAIMLRPGAIVFLKGDLGSGKSVLARAIIRYFARDNELEVPSPTFSLLQHYAMSSETGLEEIIHADLYRIGDPAECLELGLSDPGEKDLILIEWPEKGDGFLPQPSLVLSIDETKSHSVDERLLSINCDEDLLKKLIRSFEIRQFLQENWSDNVLRYPLTGDASSRSYETVLVNGDDRVLMNAPKTPDGPPVRDGKPYSQIAHLAEDISAFVGVQKILNKAGLRVPRIDGYDLNRGLILLENLGEGKIIARDGQAIADRYLACAGMLANFHKNPPTLDVQLSENQLYQIPDYDRQAMLIEVELLLDWYAPRYKGAAVSQNEKVKFLSIWNALLDQLADCEKHLCMRDFHSPNIIWREEFFGDDKIGLIDFQDCVLGPSSYDLASLAQDARIDISEKLENTLFEYYCDLRSNDFKFCRDKFAESYAIMAAQRATKILGIFVRLEERDNKSAYIKHLPRLQSYLSRSFKHPVLSDYRQWYHTVVDSAPDGTV